MLLRPLQESNGIRNTRAAAKMGNFSERQLPETRSTRSRLAADPFRALVNGLLQGQQRGALGAFLVGGMPLPSCLCFIICMISESHPSCGSVERLQPLPLSQLFPWYFAGGCASPSAWVWASDIILVAT